MSQDLFTLLSVHKRIKSNNQNQFIAYIHGISHIDYCTCFTLYLPILSISLSLSLNRIRIQMDWLNSLPLQTHSFSTNTIQLYLSYTLLNLLEIVRNSYAIQRQYFHTEAWRDYSYSRILLLCKIFQLAMNLKSCVNFSMRNPIFFLI